MNSVLFQVVIIQNGNTYGTLLHCTRFSLQLDPIHCSPFHRQMAGDWCRFLHVPLFLLHTSHCTQNIPTIPSSHRQQLQHEQKKKQNVLVLLIVFLILIFRSFFFFMVYLYSFTQQSRLHLCNAKTKWLSRKLTTFLFAARDCLFIWSQLTAVLSTVRWRGIGAGSCQCLYSSSTLHIALGNRPISVATIDS